MEKINVQLMRDGSRSVYDYTEDSLKILANKINEIIDVLNKKECCTTITMNSEGLEKHKEFITLNPKQDWEKEFDKRFGGGLSLIRHMPETINFDLDIKQFIRNLLK